ncbi:MAG: hypothetical protein HY832_01945 [Candidatus Aenigmarchaeota archaeon]|nr:hypothetical protein [Candidatus Aenigmarchaeota archaeon]
MISDREPDEEFPTDALQRMRVVSDPALTAQEKAQITTLIGSIEKLITSIEEIPTLLEVQDLKKKTTDVEQILTKTQSTINEFSQILSTIRDATSYVSTQTTLRSDVLDRIEHEVNHVSSRLAKDDVSSEEHVLQIVDVKDAIQNQQQDLAAISERMQTLNMKFASMTDAVSTLLQHATMSAEDRMEKNEAAEEERKNTDLVLQSIQQKLGQFEPALQQIQELSERIGLLTQPDMMQNIDLMGREVHSIASQFYPIEERLAAVEKQMQYAAEISNRASLNHEKSLNDIQKIMDDSAAQEQEKFSQFEKATNEKLEHLLKHATEQSTAIGLLAEATQQLQESDKSTAELLETQNLAIHTHVKGLQESINAVDVGMEKLGEEFSALQNVIDEMNTEHDEQDEERRTEFAAKIDSVVQLFSLLKDRQEQAQVQHEKSMHDFACAVTFTAEQQQAMTKANTEYLASLFHQNRTATEEVKGTIPVVHAEMESVKEQSNAFKNQLLQIMKELNNESKQEIGMITYRIDQIAETQTATLHKQAERLDDLSNVIEGLSKSHWDLSQHVKTTATTIEQLQKIIIQQETDIQQLKEKVEHKEAVPVKEEIRLAPIPVVRRVVRRRKKKITRRKKQRTAKRHIVRRKKTRTIKRGIRHRVQRIVYDVATQTSADEAILNALASGKLRASELARTINLDRRLVQSRLRFLISTGKILQGREGRFVYYLLA